VRKSVTEALTEEIEPRHQSMESLPYTKRGPLRSVTPTECPPELERAKRTDSAGADALC